MARSLIAMMTLLSVTVRPAMAQEVSDDVVAAAQEAGVSPIDLAGASNTTGLEPKEYLYRTGELLRPIPHGYLARVRLTYYNLTGRTYSGIPLYLGSTACSWNFSIGQRFRFTDGEIVTCIDRGILGSTGWLDVWQQPVMTSKYGQYATVEVIP